MEQPAATRASQDNKEVVDTTVASATDGSDTQDGSLINASGHKEELDRNFNLVSICSYAITAGNTWVSLGGTIVRTTH